MRSLIKLIPVLSCLLLGLNASGQIVELRPEQTLLNRQGYNGIPVPLDPGHDPALGQFGGFISFGGVAAPAQTSAFVDSASFADNAFNTGVPVGMSNGAVSVVLSRAMIGAPYLARQVSYLFGSIISVPDTDENGNLLTAVRKEDYWVAEPFTTNNHAGGQYYWSINARVVFAVQPGPISITWKKAEGTRTEPADYSSNPENYSVESGTYYRLYEAKYVVSASPAKTPRKMFWTEGVFRTVGKPVTVPTARVGAVKIVYNSSFPERVDAEYQAPGDSHITDTNRLQETRTLWYDSQQGQIFAYNREGRVFLELLGDAREDGVSRQHLGYEIVDVYKQPTPNDVTINLGEVITAYQDGRNDSDLFPNPLSQTVAEPFLFAHTIPGNNRSQFYAVKETQNLNDVLVHWMQEGEVGLRWPFLLVRYKLAWPSDAAAYSHYVRPDCATDAEARLTAIPMPIDNVPYIQFQDKDAAGSIRAKLTEKFEFYTRLDASMPAHRSLLRFTSGDAVSFERVFSWLDANLKTYAFRDTVATNLSAWNTNRNVLVFDDIYKAPRVIDLDVNVGDRILPPGGEFGGLPGQSYWSGHIRTNSGTSFNVHAYVDPFVAGFDAANQGAIIPVNAIPGSNNLEIWWFRKTDPDLSRGFKVVYWPSVIGRYTIHWPSNPREIVLASNAGSGGLPSLEAKGSIYYQNDPALPGYNPNEEHALMLAGQAYALRDDLNNTTAGPDYTSEPYVLLEYQESDDRPAMAAFHVLREKPSAGLVFDYITEAGKILQAPMPLPLLEKPVEGSGPSAVNYNTEPTGTGDLPTHWDPVVHAAGPYSYYANFTYRDRKNNFWVYRSFHQNLPRLAAGSYNTGTRGFDALPDATAVAEQDFSYTVHASRRVEAITMTATPDGSLPRWLSISGLTLSGRPHSGDVGSVTLNLLVTSTEDKSQTSLTLNITVAASGSVVTQEPLQIVATTPSGDSVPFIGRPPYLAESSAPTNSFTMQFYYKTLDGFAWPGLAHPPATGSIVPYLRAKNGSGNYIGPVDAKTNALEIVYRPVWPAQTPTLNFADTLTVPKLGLPAVRGQTSLKILYQQSIAADMDALSPSAILHDPTREKVYDITLKGLDKLPAGIRTDNYQGKTFFPNLPPHLAQRVFFDPNRGSKGQLVLRGEFKDEPVGLSYLLLNVLRGNDLTAVKDLCPTGDPDKSAWDQIVDGLSTVVQTFHENPQVPGTYVPDPAKDVQVGVQSLAEVSSSETAVDSYALSASGPGTGYVTLIAGNGFAFTPEAEPVSVYIIRVASPLTVGELKVIPSPNPLNEQLTMQHTADLAGRFDEYEYDWRIAPPIDGQPPEITSDMSGWTPLASGTGIPRFTLGGAGIQALTDNYIVMRYRPVNPLHPLYNAWSDWTQPQLAEGWIKRVLAGINPFNQRVTDLFNNQVNTDVSILTQAGHRWEGDVALNLENINNFGLIEIYETVLRRGRALSIDAGINYGPANDALLLAAGYLNDLYMMLGNEAWADASNPTIGIGTKDQTYGEISTALFAFKGQVPSLLEEELALLRGRDDFLQPGVDTAPVYNRLYWNYTRGIDSGEVIYALNYNIQEDPNHAADGVVNADDARVMYPQGHGDAYGHYLTALDEYYSLLLDADFDWVPRTEAVTVLGKPVQVDYLDERKFAAAASALARAGRQVFDLTWRQEYLGGKSHGWSQFSQTRSNTRRIPATTRYWGLDHWGARVGMGSYVNWVVGNAILPDIDPDPAHEGIQKIDRTTVPELKDLATAGADLQSAMDNAEGNMTPLRLPQDSIVFDINPNKVTAADPQTHFEQVYQRAISALNNAVVAFDDAKDVTRLMRSESDSLSDFQAQVAQQELAYAHQLVELYGTPYPDDVGPGKTYSTGYDGPDLIHYSYVDTPELTYPGNLDPTEPITLKVDSQVFPSDYNTVLTTDWNSVVQRTDSTYDSKTTNYVELTIDPHGFFGKPSTWTGQRPSPGKVQQAISGIIHARNALASAAADIDWQKSLLDKQIQFLNFSISNHSDIRDIQNSKFIADNTLRSIQFATQIADKIRENIEEDIEITSDAAEEALPQVFIAGLAAGGDLTSVGRSVIKAAGGTIKSSFNWAGFLLFLAEKGSEFATQTIDAKYDFEDIAPKEWDAELKSKVIEIANTFSTLQGLIFPLNAKIQELDDAKRNYRSLVAEGERVQQERETFRQHAAAVIQGYRTRDAAFRIFRNEKLERYKTLYDLAAQYAFLAANAYDYETGLLNTQQGQDFLSKIVQSRALGVVKDGQPQFAGSDTGDPGLSSALAEMKADWDVLKGRLGFNNPDQYGTTVSLRTENFRILPTQDGADNWKTVLQGARMANVMDDPDVRRYCMQISRGNNLPVPGIVLDFSTTISDGLNLFGKQLASGDHNFSPSSFATKIFAAGVVLEGYKGMDNPSANSSAVAFAGGSSPTDPSVTFLDPDALSATPYVYLIPVGVDSMRSPPLGDVSNIRVWQVNDITIPLPFNIGGSEFSTKQLYTSSDSLTEPLFGVRKHQAFRPVSSTSFFASSTGLLYRTQYTNSRLIGRSVWNSGWKLVIPGHTLLSDPNEGLDRFIKTVTDVKLYFITYSYAGN